MEGREMWKEGETEREKESVIERNRERNRDGD